MPEPIRLIELAARSVADLGGVGDKREKALAKTGITTVLDLLTHYPRRYLDRTRQSTIEALEPGEEATLLATIGSVESRRTRQGKVMVTARISDASGSAKLVFFNQPWRQRQLVNGDQVLVFGKLESFWGGLQLTNPVVDPVGDKVGRIIPVYPQSPKAGVTSWELCEHTAEALRRISGPRARGLDDPLPADLLAELGLIGRQEAFEGIHRPESLGQAASARKRLVFDELLRIQLSLVRAKRELEASSTGIEHLVGPALPSDRPDLVHAFTERLEFALTGAQERCVAEILEDLAKASPMHRLLQGDVGAGKTVVALSAMLAGVQGGFQGALMAPTEVLAEQHHLGVSALLDDMVVEDPLTLLGERELRVALLTSRLKASDRRKILLDLAAGTIDIVVGTHALIQDAVTFSRLGVAVIDEQHRFGVEQRDALRHRGPDGRAPDVLVMTATPIPRTAAMTVYGDLDVSVLDELPPGRTPIVTSWAQGEMEEALVWDRVRQAVARGERAYVVCPLVEMSDALEVRSAEETHEELTGGELSGLRLGLLHGRMSSDDKEEVMTLFRRGDIDVLVATTVIEVGVDVPEASVMVILDADRFGIAQLHQLRGRVGRGAAESECHLVTRLDLEGTDEELSSDARERLTALVRSTDGFELAEVDLDLRGEGTIMGERQKGINDLKLASLRRDRETVAKAREVAIELLDRPEGLGGLESLVAEVDWFLSEDSDYLMKG